MSGEAIKQALEKLDARYTAQPETARVKSAPATARLISGLVCETVGPNGERVVTDMPPAMGGTATGPNPGWLLRAAMASCAATVIASRAARLGIGLKMLEVSVHAESDLRGVLGLDPGTSARMLGQRMKVRIASDDASAQALEDLVRWADAHSPVGCTICSNEGYALQVEVVPAGAA